MLVGYAMDWGLVAMVTWELGVVYAKSTGSPMGNHELYHENITVKTKLWNQESTKCHSWKF